MTFSPGTHQEWPERLLRPFAEVRAGEAIPALVLAGTLFLLLTAYYLPKGHPGALSLMSGGAEVKAYAAPEQGKRLFAIVGIGSSIGALAGAALAGSLLKRLSPHAELTSRSIPSATE